MPIPFVALAWALTIGGGIGGGAFMMGKGAADGAASAGESVGQGIRDGLIVASALGGVSMIAIAAASGKLKK